MVAQVLRRYSISICMSASDASSAMVRMMKPPFSSGGNRLFTLLRKASRSASFSMRCEMPMCGSCGRYTSMRPAMEICVDRRAPLVPIGSLLTCTMTAWPSYSSFSIGSGGADWPPRARFPDVGHMKECCPFQADIDERRLHARQHAHNFAKIDVAGATARRGALDMKLLYRALQSQGDTRFLRRDVDEDVFAHGCGQSWNSDRRNAEHSAHAVAMSASVFCNFALIPKQAPDGGR